MFDGLPRELVLSMLRTVLFDRFSAPLCEALANAKFTRNRNL